MPAGCDMDIELGEVFYLTCSLCVPPKPKYFVVVQPDPLRMVLINSKINAFLLNKPRSMELQVRLLQESHDFLDHDSYLACDHLSHEYSRERLSSLLQDDPSIRRGQLHDNVRAKVALALTKNHLIQGKYLREIAPLWRALLDA